MCMWKEKSRLSVNPPDHLQDEMFSTLTLSSWSRSARGQWNARRALGISIGILLAWNTYTVRERLTMLAWNTHAVRERLTMLAWDTHAVREGLTMHTCVYVTDQTC